MLDMLERKYSVQARTLNQKNYQEIIQKIDPKLEFEMKNRFIDEKIE
jgi:hypothetical protein